MTYIHNFFETHQGLELIEVFWGFETLSSTLSYIKDKRKAHSYVTLMNKIQSLYPRTLRLHI